MKRIAAFVLIASSVAAQGRLSNEIAWIHGTIEDARGSIIPGISVAVSSNTDKCDAVSNVEGKFNCSLPPGVYSITAKGANILPYRRAAVSLKPGDHKFVILRPVFDAPSDQQGIAAPSLKYEVKAVRGAGDGEVVVQYESSTVAGDEIVFRGQHLMLTFDTLAAYGNEIICRSSLESCTATGAVSVELGRDRLQGNRAAIDLRKRSFVLTREPMVTRGF